MREVIDMRDINIAGTLTRKRREKAVTQEELAHFLGVSKASVSKWETGASYPDISLLPSLATYFDISIDELLDYNPQMTREQIRALYQHLTEEVIKRPIEETIAQWREVIRKYYACYPLLAQLGVFMLNNVDMISDQEEAQSLLREVASLLQRVEEESTDLLLQEFALKIRASCHLALGEPDTTLMLLEKLTEEIYMPPELLVASAYQQKGENEKARRVSQTGLLQNLVVHMNFLSTYLNLVVEDDDAFNATIARAQAVSQAYGLSNLHPYIKMSFDFLCAVGYAMRGEQDSCLDALEALTQEMTDNKAPMDLHGDAYFDLVEPWISELDNGSQLPRNANAVRRDFISLATKHPAFAGLVDNRRYQDILARLDRLKDSE